MRRREFIYTTAWGSAIGMAAPPLYAGPPSEHHPVLLVIQLAGGNDGLNTVVPIDNDHYYAARPKLGIKSSDTLKINSTTGLNGNLAGMMNLYDSGQLAIVEGVGYPNPNRSHFRSTEIWHTGSDADTFEQSGWLGRYFDAYCSGQPASVGLAIGKQNPQAFSASVPTGVTFFNKKQLKVKMARGDEEMMMQMMGIEEDNEPVSGNSIDSLAGGGPSRSGNNDPLSFLETTAREAQDSSQQIDSILNRIKPEQEFPGTGFAQDLKVVSQLIRGGMPTKIYYLSLGGFDTHSNQAGSHALLMKELGDALLAFNREQETTRHRQRTAVMVYSEFGRRVKENASGGTDHGVAGPVFVTGGGVKGGLYGARPELAPDKLIKGDIAHTTDYRSVYATLLEKHMRVDAQPVLLEDFPPLAFL